MPSQSTVLTADELRPATRRRFVNEYDRLSYLELKAEYWLYIREVPSRAKRFVAQVREIVTRLPADDPAIVLYSARCLLARFDRDHAAEIVHTKRLLSQQRKLIRTWSDCPPASECVSTWRRHECELTLSTLEILAALYAEAEQWIDVRRTVGSCAKFACDHGLPYDQASDLEFLLS